MILEDFHVHSSFSDGKNTPEEIALAAAERGLTRLGFSDHSYAPYDAACCMPEEKISEYLRRVAELKAAWRGKLEIYCGIEQDFYSPASTTDYDYVIGSVHYIRPDWPPVDDTPEKLAELVEEHFGGDVYAMTAAYFETVGNVYGQTRCDIIGHFDLVAKFNEKHPMFDTNDPRYIAAWRAAADKLLKTGGVKPFEINTGAISRGWRGGPYPAPEILRYLSDRGAVFVLSSDSHSAETLCYAFPAQERAAAALGLKLVRFGPG